MSVASGLRGLTAQASDLSLDLGDDVGDATEVRARGFESCFRRALSDAHIVVSLTTRPASVSRSAYDAVWARRPLVVSGGPQMRELFPYSVAIDNTAASIREGLATAAERYPELASDTDAALALALERWEQHAGELIAALS